MRHGVDLSLEMRTYLQMFQHNKNVSLKGVIDWNTEEHGDHVTVYLQSFICAAPEYCDSNVFNKYVEHDEC